MGEQTSHHLTRAFLCGQMIKYDAPCIRSAFLALVAGPALEDMGDIVGGAEEGDVG